MNGGVVISFPERHDKLCELTLELYKACAAQHDAIDRLFAMMVEAKPGFYPSHSGQPWLALLAGNAAMKRVDELRLGKDGV